MRINKKVFSYLAAFLTALSLQMSAFAEAEITAADFAAETPDSAEGEPILATSNFTLPTDVRAAVITPGVDFAVADPTDEVTVNAELDGMLERLNEIGLDCLYLKTYADGVAYYNTDMNDTGAVDVTALAVAKANEYGCRVYLIYDVNYAVSTAAADQSPLDNLISQTHRFAIKYPCDGIILSDYYSENSQASYSEYMKNGSGVGYENWLYDKSELYFSTAADIIHITDNSIPVGLYAGDMWANASSDEAGSATEDPFQAYFDGYCDTKKFIERGYADFVVADCAGSLTSSVLPFEEVAGWWGKLCETYGKTLYLVHFNEKLGGDERGWYAEDQLLRQLSTAKDISAYGGSAMHSYQNLLSNTSSATNIRKFYDDEINEQALFEDLVMQSPSKFSFTTYEPFVDFMGTFDENFDVYFNNSKIKLNNAGNFYFEEALAIGQNKFTIEHKGTVYTYKIERKIIPLNSLDESIKEGATLEVNGETRITLSAAAYKGASVVAYINGKYIDLTETESTLNDDINSSYAIFTGVYTVPKGIVSKEQDLGQLSVTATYSGYTRTLYGAYVKVLADPEPVKVEISSELYDQDTVGTGEVVGTMDAVHTADESCKYVRVNDNYTIVYNGKTTGNVATPDFAQMPAGSMDYYSATSGSYYVTESGKRFSQNDSTIVEADGIGSNILVVNSTGTYGMNSYFKIGLDTRTTFNVSYSGVNYYTSDDFTVTSFKANYVYITFDNITQVTKIPDLTNNLVFSSGKWETVVVNGIPKFRMVLQLRQPGVYAGCGASYDSNDDLVLSFGVTTNDISDYTVCIDPGHGYCKSATLFDPGAVGEVTEYSANIGIATQLKNQLEALGAKVVFIQTDQVFVLTNQRPAYGRSNGANIFISIHANKVVNASSVRGTEVYYFTEFSQPMASAISSEIASYFTNNVYTDGANKNRGAKYSYYWVTLQQDFPSVLIETGFVSNYEDAMAIVDPTHQAGIAGAIVQGIKNYISRSSLS